jgi:transposase
MLNLVFSSQDIESLHYERFHHPHPRVRMKMEALLLKSKGLSHQEITRLMGISPNTLRRYLREYAEGGLEGLKQLFYHRPQSELASYQEMLSAHFLQHPPSSIGDALIKIEELTGIARRPTQIRHFLRTLGVHCSRPQTHTSVRKYE